MTGTAEIGVSVNVYRQRFCQALGQLGKKKKKHLLFVFVSQ